MITSAGVGSGLDVESIITQLMQIEREPLNNLDRKQQALDVQISALGNLKNAISTLASSTRDIGDTTKFGHYDAVSQDELVFEAEIAPGTRAENHTIDVQQLATAHQLATALYSGGVDSSVTRQDYQFSVADEAFDVTIDSTNDTLLGLRDAINDASGNTTVNASILNLAGGSRLILTARNSGVDNSINVSGNIFQEATPATDASFTVDGFAATSASNTVTDVMPGVTINLKSIGSTQLDTTRNTESFRLLLDEFVTNFNTLISDVDALSEGDLRSDGTLRNLKSDLSRAFFDEIVIDSASYSPFNLGLTFDRTGVLSIDESVFSEVSTQDTENFIVAMSDPDTGFSQRVIDILDRYTEAEGLISAKEDSLDSRKRTLEDQSGRLEYRLEQAELRYRRQFTALDTLMSQLQSTSSYLTDQLSSLNNNNGS